jgi:MscS family membrane protein
MILTPCHGFSIRPARMNKWFQLLVMVVTAALSASFGSAADAAEAAPAAEGSAAAEAQQLKTAAAAAVATAEARSAQPPDFLELLVDAVLSLFDIKTSGNTTTHYIVSGSLLLLGLLARRIVTQAVFPVFARIAARTRTTFDDKLFPALETPVASFIMVVGIFAALKVLKLTPDADHYIGAGARVAMTLSVYWIIWRALAALLEHGTEIAKARNLGVAVFMPWIRKTLLTVFTVLAVLITLQSLGYNVKTILAGLGIGGLAFALAAQDTLANVFGAVVVAVDQPFRIGEVVRIGQNVGMVEDVGIRSTRIRLTDKSLMIVPNKTVATETITNLSRFTRRRIDQVIGLTYSTSPAQMSEIVEEIRRIISAEPEVDKGGIMVFFRDFSASSLDIWVVYEVMGPDFQTAMRCRQRVNLAIMNAIEARGLSFAFPTQTVHFAGEVAEALARRNGGSPSPTTT